MRSALSLSMMRNKMITSKQIINLSEDWLKRVRGFKNTLVDIYDNPGSSDITNLTKSMVETGNTKKSIRFIADATKKTVYVWDAMLSSHVFVVMEVSNRNLSQLLCGYGNIINGKIVCESLPDIDSYVSMIKSENNRNKRKSKMNLDILQFFNSVTRIFESNWNYLDRYISGSTSILNKYEIIFYGLRWE
jgi:hypothetical protein